MEIIVSSMVVTNSLHPAIMETWNTEPLQDVKTGVEYCCLHDNTGNKNDQKRIVNIQLSLMIWGRKVFMMMKLFGVLNCKIGEKRTI